MQNESGSGANYSEERDEELSSVFLEQHPERASKAGILEIRVFGNKPRYFKVKGERRSFPSPYSVFFMPKPDQACHNITMQIQCHEILSFNM